MANAFKKLKSVQRTGYGVMGGYLQLYVADHSIAWVKDWFKEHARKLTVAQIATGQERESGALVAA